MEKYNQKSCIDLLKHKKEELILQGQDRYPSRADFTSVQVNAIKSFLGPWPRALEQAGLKPVDQEKLQKKAEKRIEKKRRDTQQKKQKAPKSV